MDFPDFPTVGQVWPFAGRTWVWTGRGWASIRAGGQATDMSIVIITVYSTPSSNSAAPPYTLNYV